MTGDDAIVYVVDDDASVRKALARLIGSVGLTVRTFGSAQEFLDEDRPDRAACLILDVRMPGLSGLDLQERLSGTRRPIPIIFISGHANVPTSVRAMKAGAVEFLEKPFDEQKLLDAIRQGLERSSRERATKKERSGIRRRVDTLTPREREVFSLVVTGMLNKQIGSALGTSEKTIKVHRARVMKKMKAGSLAELVRLADRAGDLLPKVPST